MKLKPFFLTLMLFSSLAIFTGCGGGKEPGVADAPDSETQELTPEEEAGEKAYTGQKK